MTSKVPPCDKRLSKTQVRNPELPKLDSGNDSWIESVPWDRGEATAVSVFGAGVVAIPAMALVAVTDIFLPVPEQVYGFPPFLFVLVFLCAMWCVRIEPARKPPLELGTESRKHAWKKYHALPQSQQSEVDNAFRYFMEVESTGPEYNKAHKLWADTLECLTKREQLVTVVDNSNPRLEEAQHDLERLKGEVKELENGS